MNPPARSTAIERLVGRLAGLTMLLFPLETRSYMADDYVDAVVHRWRQLGGRRGPMRALLATLAWLLTDAARSAPQAWREARRLRRRSPLGAGSHVFETTLGDLRFAWRGLRQSPGFTIAAVVVLALTIGANTAILGVADAVLFRPLPYDDVDRLRLVQMADPTTGARYFWVRYAYLEALARHGDLGEVGMAEERAALVAPGEAGAIALRSAQVSANYFSLLGVRAFRGRLLARGDPPATGSGGPAVVSYGAWRRQFGGDQGLVGSTVHIGDATFDVVGILPPSFVFPTAHIDDPEVVTVMRPPPPGDAGGTFDPIVRLAPDADPARVEGEFAALMSGVPPDPDDLEGSTRPVLDEVRGVLYATGTPIMRLLLLAAALVLLLGCATLANLMLVRSKRLEGETGVRVALGASRSRLVRPIILESLLLSLAGAGLAVGLARSSFGAILRWMPPSAYGGAQVGIDGRVVLWTLGLGVATAFTFAVVPAWRAARADPQALLRAGGGPAPASRGVLGRPMVIVQVALSVTLVFGASLTGRVALDLLDVPLGFSPEHVSLLSVAPQRAGHAAQDFYRDAMAVVAGRPGVLSVGAGGSVPLVKASPWARLSAATDGPPIAGVVHVLPGFFETTGISVLRGRALSVEDVDADAQVAVVSEEAGRRLFGSTDALGRTFVDHRDRTLTVVGVVADALYWIDGDDVPPVYVVPGDETRRLTIVVRTATDSPRLLEEVRHDIAALAPDRVVSVRRWDDAIGALTAVRNPRFQTLVLGGFAALALVLTALGISAVVAFLVASRARELAIRLALGGTPNSVVGHVLGRALPPILLGTLCGVLATQLLSGLAEAQLFEVHADDPRTLVLATVTAVAAAAAAAYLPARRAAAIDPALGQRVE